MAEDERALSRALTTILEKNHYTVDAVYNGEDALEYMKTGNYDAAIFDIMMPVTDGMTALKQLRARGNTTPVIMLTAKAEIEDRVLGLDSGANDYLTKPFDSRELLARIRAITRSYRAADSRLTFGNLTLNRAPFELSSPTACFRLAKKEYLLMEILLSNPQQLVSSERFLEKVWGYDSDAEVNVVWVYISYLRKKLAALNANIMIRAVRNAGYSLELAP